MKEISRERAMNSSHPCFHFIHSFYRVIRTVQVHKNNNQALKEAMEKFAKAAFNIDGHDEIIIEHTKGRFFVQQKRIYITPQNFKLMQELSQYFESRELGRLIFRGLAEVDPEELMMFFRVMNVSIRSGSPFEWICEQIKKIGLHWVEALIKVDEHEDLSEKEIHKEKARKLYLNTVISTKKLVDEISKKGHTNIRKVKRMIQDMVDLIAQDETVFIGLSTIRAHDDYTFLHSINVAVLSVCLGKRIGLSPVALQQLGISGLLHDLGKVDVPKEILLKPGGLEESEWMEIRKHPLWSVSRILKLGFSEALTSKVLLAPFEHHIRYDLRGYPKISNKKKVSLFGRIISIADVYDALTSPRVYRPMAHSPDYALSLMVDGAGKEFDPILLKVFINMMGVYPVGTLVELENGELALVAETVPGGDPLHPVVVTLVEDGRGGLKRGEVIDLGAMAAKGGSPSRILRSANPATFGIQPVEFLL